MSVRRTTVAMLVGVASCLPLLLGTAPAGARLPAADLSARERLLWATVNVCDTPGHPDGIGIRGSMPGTGDRRHMLFMRLELQFYRAADGRWHRVGRAGDSGFLALGHGAVRARQAGRTFTVTPPRAGRAAFRFRGFVTFEWRRDGVVVRRARRATSAGHPGTPGADPEDFSADICSIR